MLKWLISTGIGLSSLGSIAVLKQSECSLDSIVSNVLTILIIVSGIYNVISTGDIASLSRLLTKLSISRDRDKVTKDRVKRKNDA